MFGGMRSSIGVVATALTVLSIWLDTDSTTFDGIKSGIAMGLPLGDWSIQLGSSSADGVVS